MRVGGPQCHSRENGNPAAGSPARENHASHRRRGALDPRLRGDDKAQLYATTRPTRGEVSVTARDDEGCQTQYWDVA